MSFLNSRLGLAIVAALAVLLGAFVSDVLGWVEFDPLDYVLTAAAGFVGGYIGWSLRRKQ